MMTEQVRQAPWALLVSATSNSGEFTRERQRANDIRCCDPLTMSDSRPPASVRFPEMRARLKHAIDTLCDADLQERLWIHGERSSAAELGFDDTLLFVIDVWTDRVGRCCARRRF